MTGLDDTDVRMLELLRADGRINIRALAEHVDLPETTARDRLHRLEREGFLRGYQAVVDSKAIGLPVRALVLLEAPQGQTTMVAHALWSDPAVLSGHALSEKPNGLAVVLAAKDTERLGRVLERWRHDHGVEIRELLLLDDPQSQPVALDEVEWEHAVLKTLKTGL